MAKNPHDKALQRALLQWRKPEMRRLVIEALHKAHREDLIGYDKHCLIRPLNSYKKKEDEKPAYGAKKRQRTEKGRGGKNVQRPCQEKGGKTPDKRNDRRQAKAVPEKKAPGKQMVRPSQKRSGKNNGGKKRRG